MRRIFGTLLFILSVLFAAVRLAADWIGRTTVIDDAELLGARARPMIDFIADQPAAWFYGVLAVLALVGLSLHVPARRWSVLFGVKKEVYPLHIWQPPAQTAPHGPGEPQYTTWYLALENTSERTVENISVVFDGVKGKYQYGFNRIDLKFISDKGTNFSLRPGESAWAPLGREETINFIPVDDEPIDTKFRIGPMEDGKFLKGLAMWDPDDETYIKDSVLRIRVVAENIPPKTIFLPTLPGGGFGFQMGRGPSRWRSFLRSLRLSTLRKKTW